MRAYSMVLWVRVLAARDGGMATSEAAEAFAVSAARAAQREDVRPAAPRSAGIPPVTSALAVPGATTPNNERRPGGSS